MIIGVVVRRDREPRRLGVLTRRGAARRALVGLYGLRNAAPTREERDSRLALGFIATDRSLVVDDDQDGRPMAVWIRGE